MVGPVEWKVSRPDSDKALFGVENYLYCTALCTVLCLVPSIAGVGGESDHGGESDCLCSIK